MSWGGKKNFETGKRISRKFFKGTLKMSQYFTCNWLLCKTMTEILVGLQTLIKEMCKIYLSKPSASVLQNIMQDKESEEKTGKWNMLQSKLPLFVIFYISMRKLKHLFSVFSLFSFLTRESIKCSFYLQPSQKGVILQLLHQKY